MDCRINSEPTELPLELLLDIASHLRSRSPSTQGGDSHNPDLHALCLVSRLWCQIVQPWLFERIYICAPEEHALRTPCAALCGVLLVSPHLVSYVRHVSVLSGSGPNSNFSGNRLADAPWMPIDETLPLLFHILSKAPAQIESLLVRLRGDSQFCTFPDASLSAFKALLAAPTLRNLDLSGVDSLTLSSLQPARSLSRLKFAEFGRGFPDDEIFPTTLGFVPPSSELLQERGSELVSLTILDTVRIQNITAWIIRTQRYHGLRELRLGFHPTDHEDVKTMLALLELVRETLEALHLQPVYGHWPDDAPLLDLSSLPALTSLRFSLGLSPVSNPLPWVIRALNTLRSPDQSSTSSSSLKDLTLDFRMGGEESSTVQRYVKALPWSELDDILSALGRTGASITCTAFAHPPARTRFSDGQELHALGIDDPMQAQVGVGEAGKEFNAGCWSLTVLPELLPKTYAVDGFEAYELSFTPSRFFYWPGPLSWSDAICV